MKIAEIIVRTLLGALLLFASIAVLFNLAPQPELTGNPKLFMEGVAASGYLMTLIKVTELLCGLAFVIGRFVPLATVVIAPITLNILFYHIFTDRSGLAVALFMVAANLFLAYRHWDKFRPMLIAR